MELTDWQRGEIDTIIGLWKYFRYPKEDLLAFVGALEWMGWQSVCGVRAQGAYKIVLLRKDRPYVIKCDNRDERDTRKSHTYWEWRKWKAATPRQRKHMAECIAHSQGLLFQERLEMKLCYCRCMEGKTMARSLNIHQSEHWAHHVHLVDGAIKFFDYGGGF